MARARWTCLCLSPQTRSTSPSSARPRSAPRLLVLSRLGSSSAHLFCCAVCLALPRCTDHRVQRQVRAVQEDRLRGAGRVVRQRVLALGLDRTGPQQGRPRYGLRGSPTPRPRSRVIAPFAGKLTIPLVADLKRTMSQDYGVLLDDGHPLRSVRCSRAGLSADLRPDCCCFPLLAVRSGLFIIDGKGVLRFLSHNDPVSDPSAAAAPGCCRAHLVSLSFPVSSAGRPQR